jgi:hypothetical protein
MKNLLTKIAFLIAVAMLESCAGTSVKTDTTTVEAPSEKTTEKATENNIGNPVGTWSGEENGKPMQFVFNADGSGHENFQGEETRPFTWVMKNGKPYITYNEQTTEWEIMGYDAQKGTITYGALVYYRE